MYYVLSTKILQWSETANGTVIHKRCSRICGLNPRLMYLYNIPILIHWELLKIYIQVKEYFSIILILVSILSEVFLKNFFSKFEDIGN